LNELRGLANFVTRGRKTNLNGQLNNCNHANLPRNGTERRRRCAFRCDTDYPHRTYANKDVRLNRLEITVTCEHPNNYETTGTPQTLNKTREIRK
jgi:hypothetical protein